MKFLKKNIGAIVFIGIVFTLNTVLWLNKLNSAHLNVGVIQTSVLGSTLLMGYFLIFLMATKSKINTTLFGGLDTLYFWHRMMAIATTGLILLHAEIAVHGSSNSILQSIVQFDAKEAGEIALNGFILLIGLALLAKFFKYEHFKLFHRLMLVPYIVSLYHGFSLSWLDLLSFDALSIWMVSTSFIGVGSALYMLLVYPYSAFSNKGVIQEVTLLQQDVIELTVSLQKPFHYKPGQFVFIQIKGHEKATETHPFSISGSDDHTILFTIKNLGDYTSTLIDKLELPSDIRFTKGYGSMTFNSSQKQVWVGGGIGITPFLGRLRSHKKITTPTHLYYSVRSKAEAIHLDFLTHYVDWPMN
jgi:predicted ferric reductase